MNNRQVIKRFQRPLILLVLMLILTILQPRIFPTASNFKSILLAISIYGVMICGAIYPVLLGGIDLSVGAVAALSGACTVLTIVAGDYSNVSVVKGIMIGLCAGVVVGLAHGMIITNFKVPPFLITLASMNIVYGITHR